MHNREEFEEAPENSKELSHSAHANGMNECHESIPGSRCVVLPILNLSRRQSLPPWLPYPWVNRSNTP
jgi:hypothetical protein